MASSASDFSDNEDMADSGDLGSVKVKDTGTRSSGMMSRIIEFKKRQQQAGTGELQHNYEGFCSSSFTNREDLFIDKIAKIHSK